MTIFCEICKREIRWGQEGWVHNDQKNDLDHEANPIFRRE